MKKRELLTALVLILGLTGINGVGASKFANTAKLRQDINYELNTDCDESNNDEGKEDIISVVSYLDKELDNTIQNKILLYMNGEISLTNLKKDLKNNIRKRKKVHKNLLSYYNENLESEEVFNLVSKNALKIEKLFEVRKMFFSKTSGDLI
ncbi:MAG: hypothetical protein N4A38_05500 [Candidatus Gracilibacteria bacterium]|nr:hypothetical protein [Candidatus Gracilibacteria bacterium]